VAFKKHHFARSSNLNVEGFGTSHDLKVAFEVSPFCARMFSPPRALYGCLCLPGLSCPPQQFLYSLAQAPGCSCPVSPCTTWSAIPAPHLMQDLFLCPLVIASSQALDALRLSTRRKSWTWAHALTNAPVGADGGTNCDSTRLWCRMGARYPVAKPSAESSTVFHPSGSARERLPSPACQPP